jgi:bifunctional DNase/RNase
MRLVGVRVELPTNQPVVLLREAAGERYVPIFIGQPEASAIVQALEGHELARPMTHDLFKHVLDQLGMQMRRVDIVRLDGGTFYAEIEFERDGTVLRIDARPSDAIALATRFGTDTVEIHAADSIVAEVGVTMPEPSESGEPPNTEAAVEEFRNFLDNIQPEDFG